MTNINLTPPDAISINPTRTSLTNQTLTIDTTSSHYKKYWIKGMNSGLNVNVGKLIVTVCGQEGVSNNTADVYE
jgi:hypothetical protein